ncbi:MAG: alpha/beta hydrolase, partial [Verrucomicrobiota bacterium]
AEQTSDRVVLIHGLFRTSKSLKPVKKHLAAEGYEAVNLTYPSRRKDFDGLAKIVGDEIGRLTKERPNQTHHFVTHSLGGMLLRFCLEKNRPDNLGRVVLLAPPSQGSELTDKLKAFKLYDWVNGPVGRELGTDETGVFNRLGPVDYDLGVIAGNRSVNPIYSWLIPGPDDGKVAVNKAGVPGMNDFMIVPYGHTFMMNRKKVQNQILHFLIHGLFDHTKAPAEEEEEDEADIDE